MAPIVTLSNSEHCCVRWSDSMSRGQYGDYQQLVCLYLTACQALPNTGKGAITTFFETPVLDFKVLLRYLTSTRKKPWKCMKFLLYLQKYFPVHNPSIRRERINGEDKEKLPSVY